MLPVRFELFLKKWIYEEQERTVQKTLSYIILVLKFSKYRWRKIIWWKRAWKIRWQKDRNRDLHKEDLTLGRLEIPRPITEVIKEHIYYPINTGIEAPPANQSNEEKICQNSKLKCLNKDVFDIFYEDYPGITLTLKNYINDILKIVLEPADKKFSAG